MAGANEEPKPQSPLLKATVGAWLPGSFWHKPQILIPQRRLRVAPVSKGLPLGMHLRMLRLCVAW